MNKLFPLAPLTGHQDHTILPPFPLLSPPPPARAPKHAHAFLRKSQDPEAHVESEVLRASLRLCRSRYPYIHLAADVLSGLLRYQDRVVLKAVDAVLEAIRRGVEVRGVCSIEGIGM